MSEKIHSANIFGRTFIMPLFCYAMLRTSIFMAILLRLNACAGFDTGIIVLLKEISISKN